jgi:putative ABC transport system permease protein
LLGLLSLGAGYTLALKVVSPFEAIAVFFPAVLFVMLGTYCLFVSGSIALLKLLRRNRSFYYRPGNFIAVSGMIYRMKRNAAGLASICILATAVLVTLSSTVCLYLGEEDMLDQQFPRDFTISSFWPADSQIYLSY